MAQQTAVEWLVKELKLEGYDYTVEQSKQMEKEQIINAWDKRVFRGIFVKGWHIETQNGEEYYNETYNQ